LQVVEKLYKVTLFCFCCYCSHIFAIADAAVVFAVVVVEAVVLEVVL
jgi:hypothetical protein